ncbi:MAG: hypothetical protein KDA37_01725 [Planctomycetales bacterium]|nr:hypothetical protein [Planctomycetales bacterium]
MGSSSSERQASDAFQDAETLAGKGLTAFLGAVPPLAGWADDVRTLWERYSFTRRGSVNV